MTKTVVSEEEKCWNKNEMQVDPPVLQIVSLAWWMTVVATRVTADERSCVRLTMIIGTCYSHRRCQPDGTKYVGMTSATIWFPCFALKIWNLPVVQASDNELIRQHFFFFVKASQAERSVLIP